VSFRWTRERQSQAGRAVGTWCPLVSSSGSSPLSRQVQVSFRQDQIVAGRVPGGESPPVEQVKGRSQAFNVVVELQVQVV